MNQVEEQHHLLCVKISVDKNLTSRDFWFYHKVFLRNPKDKNSIRDFFFKFLAHTLNNFPTGPTYAWPEDIMPL